MAVVTFFRQPVLQVVQPTLIIETFSTEFSEKTAVCGSALARAKVDFSKAFLV